MATKNKSILLNDKYMLTATSQYKKLMSISRFVMHNKENLVQVLSSDENPKTDEEVLAGYKSFCERQVLSMALVLTLDGLNAREDMLDLVKGSKLENRLKSIYEVWDTYEKIDDDTLDEWLYDACEAVRDQQKSEDELDDLLAEGQLRS